MYKIEFLLAENKAKAVAKFSQHFKMPNLAVTLNGMIDAVLANTMISDANYPVDPVQVTSASLDHLYEMFIAWVDAQGPDAEAKGVSLEKKPTILGPDGSMLN